MKLPEGDEELLMKAVYVIGPISVAMDAGMRSFQASFVIIVNLKLRKCFQILNLKWTACIIHLKLKSRSVHVYMTHIYGL